MRYFILLPNGREISTTSYAKMFELVNNGAHCFQISKELPSLSSIVQSEVLGRYFFSDDTMKFWGQTLADFKVEWYDIEKDIIKIHAPHKAGATELLIKMKDGNFKRYR